MSLTRSARQRPSWRLDVVDAAALRLWLLTRLAVFALVSAAAWLFAADSDAREPLNYLQRWTRWDTVHYETLARWGYDGDPATGPQVPLEAFFPGFPLTLRALHAITGLDHVLLGLVVSFLAGGVAAVALARIAALEAGPGTLAAALAERTALLFLLSPSAVFLAAAYTEALFLAFALPAWLAARRGRWPVAALLAAGATSVRITGVFLAVALVVEFLCSGERRNWRSAPWLIVPGLPILGYFAYLHERTGDWMAWQHAQEEGWFRSFHWPWEALGHTWDAAFGRTQSTNFAWMFAAELLAVGVGISLTVWLVRKRRWAEATFIALQVWAFTTSYWFFSVPRATLSWWPLWVALAVWTLRRPWVLQAYLAVIAPFSVVFVLLFATGRWAG
ncbi:MAG: mannosyltransferase family protein [Sporichthyaceae bacterium]